MAIDAVVEAGEQPVVYVVSHPTMVPPTFEQDVQVLRRRLACRGHHTFLAIAEAGRLTVYSCALARGDQESLASYETGGGAGRAFAQVTAGPIQARCYVAAATIAK